MKSDIFSRHQTLWAFIVFIILAVCALGANPLKGETVAPFDQLLDFPGWSSVHSDRQAVHFQQSDILNGQLPIWMTLKDQIRTGKGFLWYPYGAGGQPLGTELCNPSFLIFLSVRDNAFAYYLVGLSKLIVSGFGGYLLLRVFLGWLPSLWGGLVFMLCGFNAAWFFWEQVSTAMWIPWLLWTTLMYLKTDDLKWLPAITITSLLLIAGGFPSVGAFGFYSFLLLLPIWNIHDFWGNRQHEASKRAGIFKVLKKTGMPLVAVGLAFLMSAYYLASFIDAFSGINLSYRAGGGTYFHGFKDLLLFLFYEGPLVAASIERTAYAGIPACIFAIVGLFSLSGVDDRMLRRFLYFNMALVILSTLIVFGILPHWFIKALPVFKNNRWNRLIVVTFLGLAALSAVGLDFTAAKLRDWSRRRLRLTHPGAKAMVAVLMLSILAVQFYSQKKLFNRFNAVTPSNLSYPLTPGIEYVKKHIKPLQSVIADDSYWFSGMLGAYGIAEWYAHSFRTDKEKKVLSELVHDPFGGATVALFSGGDIDLNSPLMDKLVIKYLMVNKGLIYEYGIPDTIMDKWNVLNPEKDIVIFENKNVTNSAYFVRELNSSSKEDFSHLDVTLPTVENINIDYSGRAAGWVVLPMHLHPGWKAYIAGRQVPYDAYLGILPAIPVQGASRILFRYEPAYFRCGIVLSFAGIVIFLLFWRRCVKSGKGQGAA